MSSELYPDNPLDEFKNEFDLDTVDGFRKFLTKSFKRICLSPSTSEDEGTAAREPKDFTENKQKGKHALPDFDENDNTYNFSHPKRGLAIIINNEDFSRSKDFGDRPGSSYDASSLYHSFRFLGFDVMPYDNLSAWKIVEVLKAAALQYDFANSDCFACAILTHGDQTLTRKEWDRLGTDVRLDLLFGSDGKAVATKAVIEIFNDTNCPNLKDKPRLFFLQACRGDKYDHGQTVLVQKSDPTIKLHRNKRDRQDAKDAKDERDANTNKSVPPNVERQESLSSSVDPPKYHTRDQTDAAADGGDDDDDEDEEEDENGDEDVWKKQGSEDSEKRVSTASDKVDAMWTFNKDLPVSPAPIFKDCLVMYATPPGHFAWRRRTGAWFIQSLCRVIETDALRSISLHRALTLVCGVTAREYQSENPGNPEMHGKKEVPVIESMLVKDIFMPRHVRR